MVPRARRFLASLVALAMPGLAVVGPSRAQDPQIPDVPPRLARLVPPSPAPASFIADGPDLIPAAGQRALDARIRALQDSGFGDIGVAIVPSIESYEPYEVGVAIYRTWRVGRVDSLGSARRDLGVLLLIVPKELTPDRRGHCWITMGLGAERYITDGTAGEICREAIIPHLARREHAAAIGAGIDAIANRLRSDPELAAEPYQPRGAFTVDDRRSRGSAPLWFALFGAAGLAGVAAFALRWRRHRPRTCPRCGLRMQRLDEQADDATLAAGQRLEEQLGSVDYDVWRCECGEEMVVPYRAIFTRFRKCARCGVRAAHTKRRTLRVATQSATGLARETTTCESCGHVSTRDVVLPQLPPPDSSGSGSGGSSWTGSSSGGSGSSGSRGSGGGSFGGSGRTAGGGGGGRY